MRVDAIVVGAGQAGLAAGYHLAARGCRFVILHEHTRVGDVWRGRWPGLSLITPASRNGLPGSPFPAGRDHLPGKDEVADYFEDYARRFHLPIVGDVVVARLARDAHGYVVETSSGSWHAPIVIVAAGAFRQPVRPALADDLDAGVVQLTAATYRSPDQVPAGDVLIVGAGNSGAQLAGQLAATHRVWLSGPATGWLPRRVCGRDVYHWIWPLLCIRTTSRPGRIIARWWSKGGHPLVGLRRAALVSAGVRCVGRVVGGAGDTVTLADGQTLRPATVIWCAGYRPDHSWIDLPVFRPDGWPDHQGGLVPAAPGLAFLGLPYQRRLNSGLMGGVAADAAEVVAALLGRRRPPI